jgi:hypothetical protein
MLLFGPSLVHPYIRPSGPEYRSNFPPSWRIIFWTGPRTQVGIESGSWLDLIRLRLDGNGMETGSWAGSYYFDAFLAFLISL